MAAARIAPPLHLIRGAHGKDGRMNHGPDRADARIRHFIEENYLFGESGAWKDSDSFLEGGILDSTGILQLIAFLGETYRITVADEEIIPENLDSIEKVAAYVERKSSVGWI